MGHLCLSSTAPRFTPFDLASRDWRLKNKAVFKEDRDFNGSSSPLSSRDVGEQIISHKLVGVFISVRSYRVFYLNCEMVDGWMDGRVDGSLLSGMRCTCLKSISMRSSPHRAFPDPSSPSASQSFGTEVMNSDIWPENLFPRQPDVVPSTEHCTH